LDNGRFDTLARALTVRGSRRAVLRSVAAVVIAGFVGRRLTGGSATPASGNGLRHHSAGSTAGQCLALAATPEAGCPAGGDCPGEPASPAASEPAAASPAAQTSTCQVDADCPAGFVCHVSARDWTGTWSTNWGPMRLVQNGGTVLGDYDWDQGLIVGTLEGDVLRGTWTEAPSRQPPRDAGDFEFTMAEDCQSFTGRWRYGSSEAWRQRWDGERQSPSG
jgi:hypothetical protein